VDLITLFEVVDFVLCFIPGSSFKLLFPNIFFYRAAKGHHYTVNNDLTVSYNGNRLAKLFFFIIAPDLVEFKLSLVRYRINIGCKMWITDLYTVLIVTGRKNLSLNILFTS
jgi:hypothetical protein